VLGYEVTMRSEGTEGPRATATVSLRTDRGALTATATGHGPFNALHTSLCKALAPVYPEVGDIELVDYKVRVLDSYKGTAAKVRVLIEWRNDHRAFATVGVSDNVIEASWKALVDAVKLELMRAADAHDTAAPQPAQAR
jgi:2-isopropylmalate synthase